MQYRHFIFRDTAASRFTFRFCAACLLNTLSLAAIVLGATVLTAYLSMTPAQAASTAPISLDEPVEATFGKAEKIKIDIPHWTADAQVIIGGGGPYLEQHISLDSKVSGLAQIGDISIVATNDRRILAVNWNGAGNNAQVIHSLVLKQDVKRIKAIDNLIVAGGSNQLELFQLTKNRLRKLADFDANNPITDFSIDASHLILLLAGKQIVSLRYQIGKDKLSFSNKQTLALSDANTHLTHQDDMLFLANDKHIDLYQLSDSETPKRLHGTYSDGGCQSMFYQDGILYVADGDKGASLYQIDAKRHMRWLASHGKLGSVNQIWAFAGKILIRNGRLRVAELNFDDPNLPITGDIYKPAQPIDQATAANGYIYTTHGATIERINFQQSGATQISNEGINLGGSRRAYVQDHIAYVADWFSGLHIYDMRIPQQPRHLGNYHTPGSSKGVVVHEHIAYVADDDHGLQIIDVNNPAAPRLLSHINSTGLAYTLKYHRHKIYLADHRGGFHIIDVANPKKPREITHYKTSGKAWAIAVKNNYVYVADDQSGLLVFDVSNPAKPKPVGQYKPGGYAEDLELHGNIAYVSFFDQGLHIIDISHPNKPKLIAKLAIPGNARSVRLRGKLAYIAGWESGMQIVDVADTKHPKLLANLDTTGSTWGVDIEGNYAYLWDWWGGVKVADISDPQRPRLIGQYQSSENIQAIAINNNHAFTAQGGNGLQVFDVTNPANPIWMTGLNLPGIATSVTTSAQQAFVALDSAGLAVVDISNPFQIHLSALLRPGFNIKRLLYHEQRLYLATDQQDIRVYDTTALPALREMRHFDANVKEWTIAGGDLIVSGNHGVRAMRLTNSATRFDYLPASRFNCLAAHKDIVAACDDQGVIHLLQVYSDRFENIGQIATQDKLLSLALQGQTLFSNSANAGVRQFDISEPKHPRLIARYRATGKDKNMAWYKDTLLFSNSLTPNSLPLLPALSISTEQDGAYYLNLPATLSMGYYHIWIQHDAETRFYPNSLHVGLKRARKPAISMEKFKQLMQQQLQKNKARQAPPNK